MRHTFPLCLLHNDRIVKAFPPDCPLGERDPMAALYRLKDRSYWPGRDDPHPFVATAAIYECCNACADRLLQNHHVRFLRQRSNSE